MKILISLFFLVGAYAHAETPIRYLCGFGQGNEQSVVPERPTFVAVKLDNSKPSKVLGAAGPAQVLFNYQDTGAAGPFNLVTLALKAPAATTMDVAIVSRDYTAPVFPGDLFSNLKLMEGYFSAMCNRCPTITANSTEAEKQMAKGCDEAPQL